MKDLKDHLDKSCNLIPIKQSIPYEITDQLNVTSKQIKELQNMVKDLQSQLQTEKLQTVLLLLFFVKILKAESLRKDEQIFELTKDIKQFKTEMNQTIIDLKKQQNEQIDNLKHELQEKNQTITTLTNNIQQLKKDNTEFNKQLEQYQIQFDKFKTKFEIKVENQTTNIRQLQPQIDTQIEQEQKNEQKEQHKNCENMLSFIQSSNLKNGIDFLLVTENEQIIQLKNNEWNNYNFGIFLLGENITLTLNCNKLGNLKIKTSHLWIRHSLSKIDCSQLGYPMNRGPGKSMFKSGGGGYGTKGEGKGGGEMYGEETLLKQIHFGSGGGGMLGGSGGGIIELIIEQQLINHGSIQSNGGNGGDRYGGGSGGSILIELQCQSQSQSQSHLNKLKQTFGTITCIGGNQNKQNEGGKGRIAIYGIELSSNDIKKIDPKPFNRLHK
ncbi:hypothetical protein RFI_39577 [Reticulomyxa filosa]|uniref:Uncharacterized protein n=1 Tax=Reticulomyxa filosa TaxID=46433 RepID=X6L9D5_RETFI|nr:hypothetical protein RFI_39577 [Reticulomyxa filosa]|eukprot:ETN97945.1 hypothetical protein RFI_39577 [Reticulomyxa filosa]